MRPTFKNMLPTVVFSNLLCWAQQKSRLDSATSSWISMMSTTLMRKSEVPVYLHKSEFYMSLDGTDDEFSVPSECMKMNVEVKNLSDLRNILLTMRYWILPAFPSEVVDYIFKYRHPDAVVGFLSEFDSAFPKVRDLVRNIYTSLGSNRACRLSAKFGRVDFLDHFAKKGTTLDMKTLKIAAKSGHLECLAYCHHVLSYNGPVALEHEDWYNVVKKESFNCLSFLVGKGVPAETFFNLAVLVNSAKCVKVLHEELHFECWVPSTMAAAAGAGRLELVKQLHELGCPWDERAPSAALREGKAGCLEHLLLLRPIPETEDFRTYNGDSIGCHFVLIKAMMLPNKLMKEFAAQQKNLSKENA